MKSMCRWGLRFSAEPKRWMRVTGDQPFDVFRPHRDVLDPGFVRGARVAGRHQRPRHPMALREFPCQRVFAPAAAHHEHGERISRGQRAVGRGRGGHFTLTRGSVPVSRVIVGVHATFLYQSP